MLPHRRIKIIARLTVMSLSQVMVIENADSQLKKLSKEFIFFARRIYVLFFFFFFLTIQLKLFNVKNWVYDTCCRFGIQYIRHFDAL